MTVEELIEELQVCVAEGYGKDAVVLFATNDMDYGMETIVIEQARMVNTGLYSGKPAIYITDGS